VLPFLGPSTARDAGGLIGDYFTDPEFFLFNDPPWNTIVFITRAVNLRSNLLESEELFNAAAIDRYSFLRDAYLQRRHTLINDGRAPRGQEPGAPPRRKTLKEMEEELDGDEPAQKKN
jgi:phospholipid-binding lipoprotein MlaA